MSCRQLAASSAAPAAVLAALLVPSAARAADPGTAAAAEFKQEAKVDLAQLAADLSSATDVLAAEVALFETQFGDVDTGDDGPVEDLVAALETFLHDVTVAREAALLELALDGKAQLILLTPGGPDEDVYPKGFGLGDGGTLDKSRAKIEKLVAKTLDKARKLIAKSAGKLRATTGHRLAATLGAPPTKEFLPYESGYQESVGFTSLTVDLAVTFNRDGLDNDGRLWAGGAGEGGEEVFMQICCPTFDQVHPVPDSLLERWSFESDPVLDPMEEGNYLLSVTQGVGSAAAIAVAMP